MKYTITIMFVLAILLIAGCKDPVGTSCGTVTPGQQDACCAMKNKNTPHIMCEGEWKYIGGQDQAKECAWQCTPVGESKKDECGEIHTELKDQNRCCQEKKLNQDPKYEPECDNGLWVYDGTSCSYSCKNSIQNPSTCKTLDSELQDACCTLANKDAITIMCVGHWQFNKEKNNCEFVCDQGDLQ